MLGSVAFLLCPSSEGDSARVSNRIYQIVSEFNFKKEAEVSGSNTNAPPPPFASPEQIRGVKIYNLLVDISEKIKVNNQVGGRFKHPKSMLRKSIKKKIANRNL